jgi:hypothetical protein
MLSLIGSALKGLMWIGLFLLAAVGVMAAAVKVGEFYGTGWWSREQLDALSLNGRAAWVETKGALETLTWALAAFGLVAALGRLKTIAKLISDFRESKGSIFELSSTIAGVKMTVSEVQKSADGLATQVGRLSDLAPTVTSTAEKLEDVLKQLADLQRIAVSEQLPGDGAQSASLGDDSDEDRLDDNWQRLRGYWFANGERLDAIIESIPHARKRSRFRRMPRTDYPSIINALADERLISGAARDLSLALHREFMSHRSRKRPVTDSIVGAAESRDAILAHELGKGILGPSDPPSVQQGTSQPEPVV